MDQKEKHKIDFRVPGDVVLLQHCVLLYFLFSQFTTLSVQHLTIPSEQSPARRNLVPENSWRHNASIAESFSEE